MPLTSEALRFTRVFSVAGLAVFLLVVAEERASGACAPCSFSYTLGVEYHLGGAAQSRVLSGSALVSDADLNLDLDLGPVQGLLQAQVSPSAILDRVSTISLGGATGAPAGDVLLARDGDVVLWVEAAGVPSARLHASTRAALDAEHAFDYTVTAQGTESPPVTFRFTLTATGKEKYPKPSRYEEPVVIGHYRNGADCRQISRDVCMASGCTRTASRLDEHTAGGLLKRVFSDSGDRCAHFEIKVSSTSFWTGENCVGTGTGCRNCGGWYTGTAVLDGICPADRPWSRSVTGIGTIGANRNDFPNPFTISYAKAGGVLGSGLPDAGERFPSTSYDAQISNCEAGGVAVSCNSIHFGMQGETLRVSTDFSRPVQAVTRGHGSLSAPQGIISFGSFPFSTQNNDVRYTLSATFAGRTYGDFNNDGYVNVGPFSLWMSGAVLWGAFDRSSVPTAVIDSIAPNPALATEAVAFAGHGTGGTIWAYEWFTHRLPRAFSVAATTPPMPAGTFVPGRHQIRFHVFGVNASPFVFATLTVNQPPVAFINHVENAIDPAHPDVSLVLQGRDPGFKSDPFHFDGSGIDFDGSVSAYEWTSDRQRGILNTSPRFDASLTVLGRHKISLRVRDDQGAWSAPVATFIDVIRPPVLLVHGICGSDETWSHLISDRLLSPEWAPGVCLRHERTCVASDRGNIVNLTFDPNGDGKANDSPADIALMVAARIQGMKTRFGVRTVNLVVHSMGGLSSRSYIQGPGFQGDVNKLVMLGTPNHGSNLADLILIDQGYSEKTVELYIPIPGVLALLRTLGGFASVLGELSLGPDLACQRDDSPAAHALRPHGSLIRNLNQNFKDEGTEDFGAGEEPADRISSRTAYSVIHGQGVAVSHTHLPLELKTRIFVATGGFVDLAHMEIATLRSGDSAVTERSLRLDNVPETGFERSHSELTSSADSVGQAREYLLDDSRKLLLDSSPALPPGQPGLEQIEGAQLLGASGGSSLPSLVQNVEVDGAATRLRVNLSWEAAGAAAEARPGDAIRLLLTSPSGATYDSSKPAPGFEVVRDGASLNATIARPAPGTWGVQVGGRGTALAYRWLAHQESGTFLAIGLSSDRTDPGKPVKLAAYVQSEGAGVAGATVYAAIAPPAGKPVSLPMVEDSRFPGLYVADFTPQAEGTYNVLAAASVQGPQGGSPVTRSGSTNFDARSLSELSITASLSNPEPQHGEAVRWFATVRNAGTAGAPATAVQFFDGLPAEGGRLLGTRTLDLPPGPAEIQTSILWLATAGAHRLVAVADPMNRAGEADLTRHVAEIQATPVDRAPPIAQAGADQVAAVAQNVVFDGRASTDDDRIVSYIWQYPAANAAPDPTRRDSFGFTLEGPYVALSGGFPSPGTYPVQLTVIDASGNLDSALLTVHVIDGFDTADPIADAGLEMGAMAGAPVTFDGTRSRDDFGIARATWDVDIATDSDGDGDPDDDQDLAGLSPTLQPGYPRPGLYRARLTVGDTAGNGPSTSDVLVRVVQPADDCTVTVAPGGDLNLVLAMARSGETVCLRPARYQTGIINISTPGVTLDGQGAVLNCSSDDNLGVVLNTPEDAAEPRGVTVRHLTVRGCRVGFLVATGAGHHLSDNAAQYCQYGFLVEARQSLLERNRVEFYESGFLVDGADNRLVDNSARGGSVGIQVRGSRQRLEGNQACNNQSDLVAGLGLVLASGVDNACGLTLSWSDEGRRGCTFACDRIRIPLSGLVVDQDTLFEAGSFSLTSGLVVTGRDVRVRFAGTELVGPEGVAIPGIELRDAPGASLSGGTIAGFSLGLLVERSDGVKVGDLQIRDADVGVDVANSALGQLSNVRATVGRLALRLDASTRGWTIDRSELAGEAEGGAVLAGSEHSLRHNHIAGSVILTGATGSHLVDNVIVSRREGISLISSGTTEIRGNTVRGNVAGILVRDSSAALIADNVVSGHRGILIEGGASQQVDGNRVEAVAAAIHLSGGRNARILENKLATRSGPAILLGLANGNEIAGNDATSSLEGIDLHSSNANRIIGNLCVTQGLLPGITLVGSKGNSIASNVLTDLWPGGVLALASDGNRIGGNELRASGAAPREIVTLGIGLVEQLRDSPGIPAGDLAKGLSLAWESMSSFAGLERLNPRTGARFFHLLADALRVFQRLAVEPQALRGERDLLRLANAQMARGAELVVRRAIQEARATGAAHALLEEAQWDLQQGIAYSQAGRHGRAAGAFGSAWNIVRAAAFSPARLSSTMTVEGRFAEGGEITYLVTLSNAGPRTQRDNGGDEFFDRLPATLQLTSVAASVGQVRADRAAGTVAWNGALPPKETVSLTIRATIRPGTAGRTIVNQGTVLFDAEGDGLNTASAPSDDPELPGSADATTFTVLAAEPNPAEIPVLSPAALLMLISLLAFAAVVALRSPSNGWSQSPRK